MPPKTKKSKKVRNELAFLQAQIQDEERAFQRQKRTRESEEEERRELKRRGKAKLVDDDDDDDEDQSGTGGSSGEEEEDNSSSSSTSDSSGEEEEESSSESAESDSSNNNGGSQKVFSDEKGKYTLSSTGRKCYLVSVFDASVPKTTEREKKKMRRANSSSSSSEDSERKLPRYPQRDRSKTEARLRGMYAAEDADIEAQRKELEKYEKKHKKKKSSGGAKVDHRGNLVREEDDHDDLTSPLDTDDSDFNIEAQHRAQKKLEDKRWQNAQRSSQNQAKDKRAMSALPDEVFALASDDDKDSQAVSTGDSEDEVRSKTQDSAALRTKVRQNVARNVKIKEYYKKNVLDKAGNDKDCSTWTDARILRHPELDGGDKTSAAPPPFTTTTGGGTADFPQAALPPNDQQQQQDQKKQQQTQNNLGEVVVDGSTTDVSFASVGGLPKHILTLREMVLLPLLYPQLLKHLNRKPPRGVLFVGPPGTGKTLTARALAAEGRARGHEISFFVRKGGDLLSKWVGESEQNLKALFDEATAKQPSIIFFDEIDGVAPVRNASIESTHGSVVSTLLALMDGIQDRGQVIVIGATNRPDVLDPALRRPGRFDQELHFPNPGAAARRHILSIHLKKCPVDYSSSDTTGGDGPATVLSEDESKATAETRQRLERERRGRSISQAARQEQQQEAEAAAEEKIMKESQQRENLMDFLVERTEGWSGADLSSLIDAATLMCLRRSVPHIYADVSPAGGGGGGILPVKLGQVKLSMQDFKNAATRVQPTNIRASTSSSVLDLHTGGSSAELLVRTTKENTLLLLESQWAVAKQVRRQNNDDCSDMAAATANFTRPAPLTASNTIVGCCYILVEGCTCSNTFRLFSSSLTKALPTLVVHYVNMFDLMDLAGPGGEASGGEGGAGRPSTVPKTSLQAVVNYVVSGGPSVLVLDGELPKDEDDRLLDELVLRLLAPLGNHNTLVITRDTRIANNITGNTAASRESSSLTSRHLAPSGFIQVVLETTPEKDDLLVYIDQLLDTVISATVPIVSAAQIRHDLEDARQRANINSAEDGKASRQNKKVMRYIRERQRRELRAEMEQREVLWKRVCYKRAQLRVMLRDFLNQKLANNQFRALFTPELDLQDPTLAEYRNHNKKEGRDLIGLEDIMNKLNGCEYVAWSEYNSDVEQLCRNIVSFFSKKKQAKGQKKSGPAQARDPVHQKYLDKAAQLREMTLLNFHRVNRKLLAFCEEYKSMTNPHLSYEQLQRDERKIRREEEKILNTDSSSNEEEDSRDEVDEEPAQRAEERRSVDGGLPSAGLKRGRSDGEEDAAASRADLVTAEHTLSDDGTAAMMKKEHGADGGDDEDASRNVPPNLREGNSQNNLKHYSGNPISPDFTPSQFGKGIPESQAKRTVVTMLHVNKVDILTLQTLYGQVLCAELVSGATLPREKCADGQVYSVDTYPWTRSQIACRLCYFLLHRYNNWAQEKGIQARDSTTPPPQGS